MMRLKKKLFIVSFVLVFALLAGSFVGIAAQDLVVLHTNDVHGRMEVDEDWMGYPYLAAVFDDIRANNDNVLILDAGDAIHGKPVTNKLEGESSVELMNNLGYAAMAPGNHDFNYGYQRLVELDQEWMEFDLLAANVEMDGDLLFDPYVVKEIGDYSIGIFGLATSDTYTTTHPDNVEGIEFTDMVAASQQYVDVLRNEHDVDMVIGLTHVGLEASTNIANEVSGIDLIVDGHSHSLLREGEWHNDTLIVQANEYTKYLGRVNISFGSAGPEELTASVMSAADVKENYEPDEEIQTLLGEYRKEVTQMILGN